MSKSPPVEWDTSDPVPSYEESISSSTYGATTPRPQLLGDKQTSNSASSSSVHTMIRQERTRRIQSLIASSILPCFTSHLVNAVNDLTIVIVPSGLIPTTSIVISTANIVAPSFQSLSTVGTVVSLSGEENGAAFWTQAPVLQELDSLLRRELTSSALQQDPFSVQNKQPQYNFTPQPSLPLPARPEKKSWFKRALPQLPGPDHDPTGETGKWDLGWRSPEPEAVDQRILKENRSRALNPDEIVVHTKFQNVSFRTESEMGLLETTTVKCIWIQIEVGV